MHWDSTNFHIILDARTYMSTIIIIKFYYYCLLHIKFLGNTPPFIHTRFDYSYFFHHNFHNNKLTLNFNATFKTCQNIGKYIQTTQNYIISHLIIMIFNFFWFDSHNLILETHALNSICHFPFFHIHIYK